MYAVRDWRFGGPGEFTVARCRCCGVAALLGAPGDEPAALYPENYPAHVASTPPPARPARAYWAAVARNVALGYPQPPLAGARRHLVRAARPLLRRWALTRPYPRYWPGGRLLDVGCGRGDFLLGMRACGWQVTGLDVSARAVALAQARGLEVAAGTIERAGWAAGTFAAITFLDSFEHGDQPRAMLAAAGRLLAPGGELLIRFPNFGSLWRQVFGPYWADIAAPRHRFFYTRAVLRRMVAAAGFAVTGCYRQPSADFSRSLRTWRRAHGHAGAELWPWARVVDRVCADGHCLLRARRE
ncbi:MAG: class I SAM-dependent methyltransferase [Terriglobales bacterium]